MYELKKTGKQFTSKFVGTGPSSYKKKRIYRAEVSQRLRNAGLDDLWVREQCAWGTEPTSGRAECYQRPVFLNVCDIAAR